LTSKVAYAIGSGAVASGIGYAIGYTGLRGLDATGAATVQLGVPVIAAAGAILLLHEMPTMRLVLASIAILGRIAIVIWPAPRCPPHATPATMWSLLPRAAAAVDPGAGVYNVANGCRKEDTMKVNKLSAHIGAEVVGIDLREPVDSDTRRTLNEAVVQNVALVIRDQQFTPEQYLAAVSLFGEPMDQHFTQYALPGCPLVHEVSNRHKDKAGGRVKHGAGWHTDHTNHVRPPKYTSLYAVSLPSKGGDTAVVSMRAGYEALPEEMKQKIRGMKTVNVFQGSASARYSGQSADAQVEKKPEPVLQPLVRTHPDNGTKALYFHPVKAENIVGMGPQESQALLSELLEHSIRDDFIYRHRWRKGDMLIWDNRAAMHKAHFDYDPEEYRLLYRVLVRGEVPA
jgi:taurine dioxygenase